MTTIFHGVPMLLFRNGALGGSWRSSEGRLGLGMLREILVRAKKEKRAEKKPFFSEKP